MKSKQVKPKFKKKGLCSHHHGKSGPNSAEPDLKIKIDQSIALSL